MNRYQNEGGRIENRHFLDFRGVPVWHLEILGGYPTSPPKSLLVCVGPWSWGYEFLLEHPLPLLATASNSNQWRLNMSTFAWDSFQAAATDASTDICKSISRCLQCPVRSGRGQAKMAHGLPHCAIADLQTKKWFSMMVDTEPQRQDSVAKGAALHKWHEVSCPPTKAVWHGHRTLAVDLPLPPHPGASWTSNVATLWYCAR